MNTTELIEIARECCEYFSEFGDDEAAYQPGDMLFNSEGLQQFAQRIEQTLQHKINELNFDIAHQQSQIEQLRKALHKAVSIANTYVESYEDLANSVCIFPDEQRQINAARNELLGLLKGKALEAGE